MGAEAPRRSGRASGLPYHLRQGSAARKANVARWRSGSTPGGSLVQERGDGVGGGGEGCASARVLGWEGAVHERTP